LLLTIILTQWTFPDHFNFISLSGKFARGFVGSRVYALPKLVRRAFGYNRDRKFLFAIPSAALRLRATYRHDSN
jgi:hypothetical protein